MKKKRRKKRKKDEGKFKAPSHFKLNKFVAIFLGIITITTITGIEIYIRLNETEITDNNTPKLVYMPAAPEESPNIIQNKEELLSPNSESEKIAYLTFDDGPSDIVTPQILDILNTYSIKATFFVLGTSVEKNPEMLKRIYNEGHKIANHTYSHAYGEIYSSVESLLNEINLTNDIINQTLGFYYGNTIFRFPGGSFEKAEYFKQSLTEMGFKYIDWNCLGNDAVSETKTADEIFTHTVNTSVGKDPLIILLHDTNTKQTTVEALPRIIEYFIAQGYEFKTIENN